MERNMMWGSLALGILGWLCTVLLSGGRPATETQATSADENSSIPLTVSRPFLGMAALLPILVWILTLPVKAPFSAGQGWGRGFLLGGVGSLAAYFVISRATSRKELHFLSLRVAATAPLFMALVVACVPLIWMRHAVIDALMGAGLGWVASTLVLVLGQTEVTRENNALSAADSNISPSNLGMLLLANGAAFAASLFAVAALGVYRDFVIASVARGTFSAVAVTLGAIVALALLLSAVTSESLHRSQSLRSLSLAISLLTIFVLPLSFGYLLGMKLLDDVTLIYVIGAGLVLGVLLLWLVSDDVGRSVRAETDGTIANRFTSVPVWGLLVALCGFMLAYQLMQGFGVGIMLLAAWPVSLVALPASTSTESNEETPTGQIVPAIRDLIQRYHVAHLLSLLLSILAVLLLSRLFATRFRADLRGVGLSDQFALFGFVAGAAFPGLLASLWFGAERVKTGARTSIALPNSASLARLGVVGLIALAPPVAMLAIWGAKVAPALFAGLALAIAGFSPMLFQRRQPLTVALFSLSISLTVTQWMHRLTPFAELSRTQRLHILLWALGALVLLALIFDYGSRIASGLREQKVGAS